MSKTATAEDWARCFRGIWQKNRQKRDGGRDDFNNRNEMRWAGWRYAEFRGWTVALTPPQRQKGKRG